MFQVRPIFKPHSNPNLIAIIPGGAEPSMHKIPRGAMSPAHKIPRGAARPMHKHGARQNNFRHSHPNFRHSHPNFRQARPIFRRPQGRAPLSKLRAAATLMSSPQVPDPMVNSSLKMLPQVQIQDVTSLPQDKEAEETKEEKGKQVKKLSSYCNLSG